MYMNNPPRVTWAPLPITIRGLENQLLMSRKAPIEPGYLSIMLLPVRTPHPALRPQSRPAM